jgi:hypothetical protein
VVGTARPAPPELDLLVQLALHDPPGAALERARALLGLPLDCERLTRLARQHRLLPMLRRNLDRADLELPEPWQERLDAAARRSARRATFLAGELILLQRALRGAGIPSLAVKGPALAALAHGTPALRTMADLDVVVRQRDLEATSSVLVSRGYHPLPWVDPVVRSFAHPAMPLHVEVHRRLDKPYLPLFPIEGMPSGTRRSA